MNKDDLIKRLGSEVTDDRVTALELAVSWLLAQQPNDEGLRFLSCQANVFEESGTDPGVVDELDILSGLVSSLRGSGGPSQDVRQKKPGS